MRRRLILSTALIALAAVIVLGIPLGAVEAARLHGEVTGRLEREADAVAGAVDDRLERRQAIGHDFLARLIRPGDRIIVTPRHGSPIVAGDPISGEVLRAHAGSNPGGTVEAQGPRSELDRRVWRAWVLIAALGGGGVLIAVALAALQARRLARPLEAIARRAVQLGDGDFSVRAGTFGVPEIDAIARGLDSSAGRIAELVAAEREFSANVSHQLRTPLTALRLRIEEAGEEPAAAARRREIDAALNEADRLEATIADLLAHARRSDSRREIVVHLATVIADHAATWRPVFGRAGRTLEVAAEKNVLARASRGTVGQVLDILLDNALRHGLGAARISLTSTADVATLTVSDGGPGISEEDRDRIFDRGASHAGGTGIGLHLARTLAESDHGSLRVLAGAPTRFELCLRRAAQREG